LLKKFEEKSFSYAKKIKNKKELNEQ